MWLIFRIFINLYYKLYRALLYPLHLLAKRSFGLIVMGVLLFILIQLFSGSDETHEPASQPSVPKQAVTIHEDGNSSFASDLLPQMTPEALRYYSQTYYWVMEHQPAGEPHTWSYADSHGTLTPESFFNNNYGHRCRRFAEVLKVGATQQKLNGIACEKKDGSWCKLGATFTPVCGLAPNRGIGAWWNRTMGDLF